MGHSRTIFSHYPTLFERNRTYHSLSSFFTRRSISLHCLIPKFVILHTLLHISPIDGRYNRYTKVLQDFFSEHALINFRVHVEITYIQFLSYQLNHDLKYNHYP